MEFIQKKTADPTVEKFLESAAEKGIPLAWDRFEGQLPECGFCETGLSCRDCLQGPCVSHPFKDSTKMGVCGKDKDVLATQTLLRLALKGTLTYLDRVSDLVDSLQSGQIKPKKKTDADRLLKEFEALLRDGGTAMKKDIPRSILRRWEDAGIAPEGMRRDLFKASQKLEGGVAYAEEILLWSFKVSLLGCAAQVLYGKMKTAIFGETVPANVEVNLGVLKKNVPNLLLVGTFSPVLKVKIVEEAKKKGVNTLALCSDPLFPSFQLPLVTNYGSQEAPLLTGAVDLIVVGDQFVYPSLMPLAVDSDVPVIAAEGLKKAKRLDAFAKEVVDKARKAFDVRKNIARDIPESKESSSMGFSTATLDVRKIVEALKRGQIKGIALLAGSNNVKFTQDLELTTLAREFLRKDILCISEGEASVSLGKFGFLNPAQKDLDVGHGVSQLLSSLGKNIPAVLDLGSIEAGGVTPFLLELAKVGRKEFKDYPVFAVFAEANRSSEVTEALWTVAMGVPTYFWPALPVTGSQKAMEFFSRFCQETFGARLFVPTDKKTEARPKANFILKEMIGETVPRLSGYPWKEKTKQW
jgi:carbon-monoxide dehydrogenase catalytic subunit